MREDKLKALVTALRLITEDESLWHLGTLSDTFVKICFTIAAMEAVLLQKEVG